jgi:hypothetical protein
LVRSSVIYQHLLRKSRGYDLIIQYGIAHHLFSASRMTSLAHS